MRLCIGGLEDYNSSAAISPEQLIDYITALQIRLAQTDEKIH